MSSTIFCLSQYSLGSDHLIEDIRTTYELVAVTNSHKLLEIQNHMLTVLLCVALYKGSHWLRVVMTADAVVRLSCHWMKGSAPSQIQQMSPLLLVLSQFFSC